MSLSVPAYRFYPYRQRLTTAIVDAARRISEEIKILRGGTKVANSDRVKVAILGSGNKLE
jgi:hypothetical protein